MLLTPQRLRTNFPLLFSRRWSSPEPPVVCNRANDSYGPVSVGVLRGFAVVRIPQFTGTRPWESAWQRLSCDSRVAQKWEHAAHNRTGAHRRLAQSAGIIERLSDAESVATCGDMPAEGLIVGRYVVCSSHTAHSSGGSLFLRIFEFANTICRGDRISMSIACSVVISQSGWQSPRWLGVVVGSAVALFCGPSNGPRDAVENPAVTFFLPLGGLGIGLMYHALGASSKGETIS